MLGRIRGSGSTTPASEPIGRRPHELVAADRSSRTSARLVLALAFIGAAGAVPGVSFAFGLSTFQPLLTNLPVAAEDLGFSFARMLAAYALSLGFALGYGYYAATRRTGERVLIPILDILQSVPILGFFPVALVVFLHLPGAGPVIGANLASVFLIFTSMSWNMAFGVYESLKSLPSDLREAADSFGVTGVRRLRRVLYPATVNRLIYNSVLSWTAGWYFLVAAEFIARAGTNGVALPGIGSFLLTAAQNHNLPELYTGLIVLIALIAALDIFVWRPLGRRAEKYRYDQAPAGDSEVAPRRPGPRPLRRAAGFVAQGVRTGVSRMSVPFVGLAEYTLRPIRAKPRPLARSAANHLVIGVVLVLVWLLVIEIGVTVYQVFEHPLSSPVLREIELLPLAAVLSFGRVALAYLLSLAVALPLAIFLVQRSRAYRIGLPVVEVIASVPAIVLFPLFLVFLLTLIGFELVAILVLMTGMLWYLFFNILSGLRAIPGDLKEAAQSLGLSRLLYYRKVVIPAILPALITGSITAFGGGWNTLIIAEYLPFGCGGGHTCQTLGVGSILDYATYTNGYAGEFDPLIVASLFTFIIVVVALNEVLWKPLYRRAVEKYRFD